MVKTETYIDKVSREKLKKEIHYHWNGKIQIEWYCLNGEWHRKNGPAIIWYYESGKIEKEIYFLNGMYHRKNGSAIISYYENGDIEKEEYWEYGKEMDVLKEMVIRELKENI